MLYILVTVIVMLIAWAVDDPCYCLYIKDNLNEWKETILKSFSAHMVGCLQLGIQGNQSILPVCGQMVYTLNATTVHVRVQLDCHILICQVFVACAYHAAPLLT